MYVFIKELRRNILICALIPSRPNQVARVDTLARREFGVSMASALAYIDLQLIFWLLMVRTIIFRDRSQELLSRS